MWYLEQIFTGILTLGIVILYMWTLDAGTEKIRKKLEKDYLMKLSLFEHKWSYEIFWVSITIVFLIVLDVTTGNFLFRRDY